MTDTLKMIFIVACWEFRRFFKIKDQIKGILITLICGGVAFGLFYLLTNDEPDEIRVAVVNGDRLPIILPEESVIKLEPATIEATESLAEQVGARKLDGLLTINTAESITLLVYKNPHWKGELEQAVGAAQAQLRMTAANLTEQQLAIITTPTGVQLEIHPKGKQPSTVAEMSTAGILIGLMLFGVFHAMGLFILAVTSEKQMRVTEQIVAAVPAQVLMDGKIVGITLATMGFMLSMVISILLSLLFLQVWHEGVWQFPQINMEPMTVVIFFVLTLLGLVFWNCFYAAVAAIIDDPNTSARTALLILPALPVGLCFFILKDPDMPILRILSLMPGFSSALLPARMILSHVFWWEIPIAIVALVVGVWMMRRLAGRIFGAVILMYGKEPNWRQIWQYCKRA